ncbi:hypothetical protein E4P82_14405 [Candidatus Competibacter phosphatis]|uniref:Flippase-like domain-containing protein n=1 Tax=Candidatus Competibacter phosphatis TaxID=221280 RepID=A0ABX1TNJ5_9GAMM|nr:lysylphosphatidylglycerol synthase domain-containing protein [Candidatus Competibacter phosphatis]NMQ20281.1 hypothetical protein [Candidatus Competibacter phosphatis]
MGDAETGQIRCAGSSDSGAIRQHHNIGLPLATNHAQPAFLANPFLFYWCSYFKAMFFNQGLPTSIGGDALRVLDVANQGFRKRDVLYGVILDRVSGLAALMLLNLLAYIFNPELLPLQVYHVTLVLVIIGTVAVMFIASLKYLRWLDNYPRLAIIKAISARLHQAFFV